MATKKKTTTPEVKPDRLVLLSNWMKLNERISELTEEETLELLEAEKKDRRRPQFILRLYGRFNTLRTQRERTELMKEFGK